MHKLVTNMLTEFRHMNAVKRRFVIIASALSVLVMLFVFQQMTIPAITMGTKTECQIPEHTHDESCYELKLVCGYEEGEVIYLDEEEQSTTAVDDENLELPNNAPADVTEASLEEQATSSDNGLDAQSIQTTAQSETASQTEVDEQTTQTVEETTEVQTTVHHHTYECYESVLVCPLQEHTHDENCVLPTIHNAAAVGSLCNEHPCPLDTKFVWHGPTESNPFGDANNFSLFTFGDVNDFGDSEGAVAMGGQLTGHHAGFAYGVGSTNTSTGLALPQFDIGLVLGGTADASTTDPVLQNGSIITKDTNSPEISNSNLNTVNGAHVHFVTEAEVTDYFAAAKASMLQTNLDMMTWSKTDSATRPAGATVGTYDFIPPTVVDGINVPAHGQLTGTNPFMNVFEIDADHFNNEDKSPTNLYVDVPFGSYVIINVTGNGTENENIGNFSPTIYNMGTDGEYHVGSNIEANPYRSQSQRTIMNFDPNISALDITASGYYLYCSVMAPNMTWEVGSNKNYVGIDGTVVFANVEGNGTASEIHYNPFIPWSSTKGINVQKTTNCICGQSDCPFKNENNEFKLKLKMHNTSDIGNAELVYEYEFNVKDGLTINGLPSGDYEIEEEFYIKKGAQWVLFSNEYPAHKLTSVTFNGNANGKLTVDGDTENIDIVNNYEDRTNLTEFTVEKLWVSNGSLFEDSSLSATVKLYQTTTEGDKVGGTLIEEVTLDSSNGYKYSWTQIPKFDENDNPYYYYTTEDYIAGYIPSHSQDGAIASGTDVITNTTSNIVETDDTKIMVNKVWDDETNSDYRPTSVEVGLYQTGNFSEMADHTVMVSFYKAEKGSNEHRFVETKVYNNVADAFSCTLDATNVPGYTLTGNDSNVGVHVEKVSGDATFAIGSMSGGYVSGGSYSWVYPIVPFTLTDIQNDIKLKVVTFYDLTQEYTIPQTNDLIGPDTAKAKDVYREDVLYGGSTIKLNEKNGWSYSWSNLPIKDSTGEDFIYEIKELNYPEYYVPTVDEDDNIKGIYTLTNTLDETKLPKEFAINLEKTWVGDTESDRPSEIQVKLYQTLKTEIDLSGIPTWVAKNDGSGYQSGNEVQYQGKFYRAKDWVAGKLAPTASDNWVEFTPEMYEVTETLFKTVKVTQADNWQYVFEKLPVEDVNGNPYTYSVKEVSVPGYSVSYSDPVDSTNPNLTITNTKGDDSASLTVNKVWEDNNDPNGERPSKITVDLYQKGAVAHEAGNTVTIEYYKVGNSELGIKDEVPFGKETLVIDGVGETLNFTIDSTNFPGYTGTSSSFMGVGSIASCSDASVTLTNVAGSIYDGYVYPAAGFTPTGTNGFLYALQPVQVSNITGDITIKVITAYNYETTTDYVGTQITEIVKGSATGGSSIVEQDKVIQTVEITPNASGEWKYTFSGLAKVDANGDDFEYYVKEHVVDGYNEPTYTTNADGSVTITNSKDQAPVITGLTVNKVWVGDDGLDTRPNEITVNLYQTGNVEVTEGTVSPAVQNAVTADPPAWENNKGYSAGTEITHNGKVYKATEWAWVAKEPGVGPDTDNPWEYVRDASGGDTSVVESDPPAWEGNTGYKKDTEVTHNGKVYKNTSWANQGAEPGVDAVWVYIRDASDGGGEVVDPDPPVDPPAEAIPEWDSSKDHYSPPEQVVYNGNVYEAKNWTNATPGSSADDGWLLLGKLEDDGTITPPVEKVYEVREVLIQTITLTPDNWSAVVENLPANDPLGQPYTYHVEEVSVPDGYEVSYSNPNASNTGTLTITNTKKAVEDFEMPETGGIGTTIFYTLSGLMLALATLLFATRKKVR